METYLGFLSWSQKKGCAGGRRGKAYRAEHLKDALVWLAWDIRWVAAGTGLGRISEIIRDSDGVAMVIKLLPPIRFISEEDEIREVIYEPNNTVSLIERSRFSSVHGILKTPDESRWLPIRGVITCELMNLGMQAQQGGPPDRR